MKTNYLKTLKNVSNYHTTDTISLTLEDINGIVEEMESMKSRMLQAESLAEAYYSDLKSAQNQLLAEALKPKLKPLLSLDAYKV
jgi:hypothetical protein